MKVDNVSGKPVKEVAVVLEQKICYHGTYTPLKMHIPLRTKKSRKRSKDRGGDIKKSKVVLLIIESMNFSKVLNQLIENQKENTKREIRRC